MKMRFIALFIILFASCTYRYENCTINCDGKGGACNVENAKADSAKYSTEEHAIESEATHHDSVFMENY